MTNTRARGANTSLLLGKETAYGTPPGGNYHRLRILSHDLGAEQELENDPVLGQGRDPVDPQYGAITADGSVNVPVDSRLFGLWLRQTFGPPVTTEDSGVYTHVFKSGAVYVPSATLEKSYPEVPNYSRLIGFMVNSLQLSMQRGGFASAVIQGIAQGELARTASSQGGTPVDLGYTPFSSFRGFVKRGGVAVGGLTSGSLTYSNNLDRVETIRADGLIDGADPTQATLSGSLTVRYQDNTLLDLAKAGTPIDLSFGYSRPDGDSITFDAHRVFLSVPRLPVSGPNGVEASFDIQAAKDETEGVMLTVTLVNTVSGAAYA